MLYNIIINQLGIVNSGLDPETDLIDWAIINYLQSWYFSEKKKTMYSMEKGKNYVWVNYNHLIENMPILGIKDKSALTSRFQKLKKLGLIDTLQTKDNTLYFDLTEYCMQVISFTMDKGNNKKVNNKNNKEETNDAVDDEQADCLSNPIGGVGFEPTAQLVYQSISISDNNNNNSFEKEKSLEHSKELVAIEQQENLINVLSSVKKPNTIYSVYTMYINHWGKRYKTLKKPLLTKKLAGQIKLLLRDINNLEEIEKMLEAFVNCDEGYLISKMHDFGLFLCDINKWRAISDKPELSKVFTTEYAKNKMYLQKKEMVYKEEEEKKEKERIEKIRQEKIQMEIYKQEKEKQKQEELELIKKQKEELERQKKEEEKRLSESFKKYIGGQQC